MTASKYILKDIKKSKFFKTFYFILIVGYIFTAYIAKPPLLPEIIMQIFLYTLAVYGVIYILLNIKDYKINSYIKWYFLLLIIFIISYFYAIDSSAALSSIELMVKILLLAIAFASYIESYEDFFVLLKAFAFSGAILICVLFFTNNLEEGRLGRELFGNPNSFALYMMLSAICSLFLFIYYKNTKRIFYILCSFLILIALILSGGRKFFIIPFIFLYFYFFAKYIQTNISKVIKYTFIFAIALILTLILIFKVQFLYNNIGYRFEGLLNMFFNVNEADTSSLIRLDMINKGIEYFKQKPFFGYGLDNYKILYGADNGTVVYSHNNYIEMLVNLGIVGFVIYYGFIIILLKKLFALKNDKYNLRNFFIAIILSFLVFDIGAVTYSIYFYNVFLALVSTYVLLSNKKISGRNNEKSIIDKRL